MKRIFFKILALLPYCFVFLASLAFSTDPDLGWHLKYGEYFFQHGSVLRDNTFSVMMPQFHWANVSWGTDLLTYAVYHSGGFGGLTILGSIVVTATFFFFSKAATLSVWDEAFLFPLLLYLEKPLNVVSFRGQQISLLFLGILIYLMRLSEKKPKLLYFTIPLFLLWVNLHGEFFLGLALFAIWIGLTVLQKYFFIYQRNFEKIFPDIKFLGSIFILSFLVTIINPFGIGMHLDPIGHLGSPILKDVAEYLSFPMLSQPWWNQVTVATLLALSLLFFYFQGKLQSKLPFLGGAIVLYMLSFEVRRYAWPAYYLIFPFLQPLSQIFRPDSKKFTTIVSTVLLLGLLTITFVGNYPYSKFLHYSWSSYCPQNNIGCSAKSAEFLKQHHLTNHLFSLYGWGGWLIWNYPEIKPTIDGRMHIWVDDKGYSAFADYYGYEQNMKDIDKSNYDVVYMSPDKPNYDHMKDLVKMGKWKIIYQDNFSGIFVRN